jgi:uncharacterized protein YndB with AHSA1/START domain
MRPVSHTLIDQIRAPIDDVFATLTDPSRLERWLPGCDAVLGDGPLAKGTKLRAQFGSRMAELNIVDYRPPNTFGWVELGQRHGWKTFFKLDPASGATAVTIREVWTPTSVISWVRGRFLQKRDVHRHLKQILQNLRGLLTP